MGSIVAAGEKIFLCPNKLSLVSFSGMTINKCAFLQIGCIELHSCQYKCCACSSGNPALALPLQVPKSATTKLATICNRKGEKYS